MDSSFHHPYVFTLSKESQLPFSLGNAVKAGHANGLLEALLN